MLNIGPRANGDVPYEITQRLQAMGEWLEINGESVYGAGAFDLDKNLHDWGKITMKQTGGKTRLYLHVYNYPLNKRLPLSGITSRPSKIYLLADKQCRALAFTHGGSFTDISLPALQTDPLVSVVVVEYDAYPQTVQGIVAKTTDDGYSLSYANQINEKRLKINRPQREGTVPQNVSITAPEKMKWKFYTDRPRTVGVDISYNYQGKLSGGKITCRINGQEFSQTVEPTGKTVGEPHEDWVIDRFLSFRLGETEFTAAGTYELELEIAPPKNGAVQLQWVWVK
jgi:alpha-L-fucosidase